jgi:hypothetical protein
VRCITPQFECLILLRDHGGDPRIGMMQALRRHKTKTASAPRRQRAKVYKIV